MKIRGLRFFLVKISFVLIFLPQFARGQETTLPIFKHEGTGAKTSINKNSDLEMVVTTSWRLYDHGTRLEYQMVALVRGNFSIARNASGYSIPYFDLDVVPLFWGLEPEDGTELGGRVLPIQYRRNTRLGQDQNFQVHLIGLEVLSDPRQVPDAEDSGTFYRIALDALTYKVITHFQDTKYKGYGPAALQAEFGYYKGPERFRVRVSVGGRIDATLGNMSQHGLVFQTDAGVYFKSSLDVKKFLEFFLQTGVETTHYFGADIHEADWQLMGGVNFYY